MAQARSTHVLLLKQLKIVKKKLINVTTPQSVTSFTHLVNEIKEKAGSNPRWGSKVKDRIGQTLAAIDREQNPKILENQKDARAFLHLIAHEFNKNDFVEAVGSEIDNAHVRAKFDLFPVQRPKPRSINNGYVSLVDLDAPEKPVRGCLPW